MSRNLFSKMLLSASFALAALSFTGCADDEPDFNPHLDPEENVDPEQPGTQVETNVSEIRRAALNANPGSEAVDLPAAVRAKNLKGVVISDKEGGNTQPVIVIVADATNDPHSGVAVAISEEANTFSRGDVIEVSLSDATTLKYNNLLQISTKNVPTLVEQIEPLEPIVVQPSQLCDFESQYVRIEQTQPEAGESGSWNSDKNKGNVTMVTRDGQTYKVRTNPTAAFGKEEIPADKSGVMCGISGVFRNTWQLLPCNADDIRLSEARFEIESKTATLEQVLAGEPGNYTVENLTVVGANLLGVMLEQGGKYIYAYPGTEHGLQCGDVITVTGKTEVRNALLQFGKGCEVTKTDTGKVTLPTPVEMTGKDFENYQSSAEIRYVSYEGTILVAGQYVNVEIEGSSCQGSLDNMTEEFKTKYNNHKTRITGWLFGTFREFVYTLPVEVEDLGEHVDVVPEGAIYYNNFDKTLSQKNFNHDGRQDWPYLDEFDGWKNEKGSGAVNVTYSGSGVSTRANEPSQGQHSLYDGSGRNNIFFSTAPTYFTIEKIAVKDQNLRFSFGTQRYAQGATNEFLKTDFEVRVSQDGQTWSQALKYDFAMEEVRTKWRVADVDFTLPAGVTELYIKFSCKASSCIRIDDLLLTAGNGGQQVVFGADETLTVSPIKDVIAGPVDNLYKVRGQIIGTHEKGFIVKDETASIFVFKKKHGQKIGSTVTVEGGTTEFGGLTQFTDSSEITLESEGSYTQPEPEAFQAAQIEAYVKSPSIKYVVYEGMLSQYRDDIYQWHTNIAIDGTEIIGDIQYPAYSLNVKELQGKRVRVTGYVLGARTTEKETLFSTMAISIEEVK